MDIITAVIVGASIAYFAYTLGIKKGKEIASPNCTHGEIAPVEDCDEDEVPESVRAFRARQATAEAARRHVAFEEAGE